MMNDPQAMALYHEDLLRELKEQPVATLHRDRPLAEQALVGGETPFSGRSSNGGFWSRKVENALSFNGG